MNDPTDATPDGYDRTKIRIGLAMVGLVVVACLVLLTQIEGAFGNAIMFAVAATALVRAFLLTRSLRRTDS